MKTHFFERSTNTVRLRSPISNHDLLEENSAHLIPICTTYTTNDDDEKTKTQNKKSQEIQKNIRRKQKTRN